MAAYTSFCSNHLIDFLLRAQALGITGATAAAGTGPATTYVALTVSGTEVTGGSYARVAVTSSLANWAGTQGAGTTAVSSGSSKTTSNNASLVFPGPTANWGTVDGCAIFDAATSGNKLATGTLAAPVTVISGGAPPAFLPAALVFQIDT